MLFSFEEAQGRIPSQLDKIIDLLKEAGEEGVTSKQLSEIGLRYGARISDLYKLGYKIELVHLNKGLYKYILRSTPSEVKIFQNAEEIILQTILLDYPDGITAWQLKDLLEENGFHIRRNSGWFVDRMKIN